MGKIRDYGLIRNYKPQEDDVMLVETENGTKTILASDMLSYHGEVEYVQPTSYPVNLNNFVKTGSYYFSHYDEHTTAKNFPPNTSQHINISATPNNAGWLDVLTAGDHDERVKQIFYRYATSKYYDFETFVRTGSRDNNNGWLNTYTFTEWTSISPIRPFYASSTDFPPDSQPRYHNLDNYVRNGLYYFAQAFINDMPVHTVANNFPPGMENSNGWLRVYTTGNHDERVKQIFFNLGSQNSSDGEVYVRTAYREKEVDPVTQQTSWLASYSFSDWTPIHAKSLTDDMLNDYAVTTFIDRSKVKTIGANSNVLFLGDSITAGRCSDETGRYDDPSKGWVKKFQDLTGCSVTNKAVSGARLDPDTVVNDKPLSNQYSNITEAQKNTYDVIFVAIGTNDAGADTSTSGIKLALKEFFDWAKPMQTGSPSVIFITPIRRISGQLSYPRTSYSEIKNGNRQNRRLAEISAMISNAALNNGCSVIRGFDIPLIMGTAFDSNREVLIPDVSSSGYTSSVTKAMSGDSLHPNDLGYTIYARYVYSLLNLAQAGEVYTKTEVDNIISNISGQYAKKTELPTKTSDLTNDSGFLTSHQDISGKVDKVTGKGLSTNDYTTEEKNKLSGIETGANKTTVDAALSSSSTNPVQNKVIKSALDNLDPLPSGGSAGQVLTKTANGTAWQNTQHQDISGKENASNKSDDFSFDLTPTTAERSKYPTVARIKEFVAGTYYDIDEIDGLLAQKADSSNIPTKTSDLINDSGFLTSHQDISGKADKSDTYTKAQVNALIPTVPSNVSAFINDAGYLTAHQDISGKENVSNKATTIGSGADDTHYPSALAVKKYVDSNGYEFVSTIPANADHTKRFVLPDGYIYVWSDGSPAVPYNANTGLINKRPQTSGNKDAAMSDQAGVLCSDLIPFDTSWKYSSDSSGGHLADVVISGIDQLVPAYNSSVILYYYRRDNGNSLGAVLSQSISTLNNAPNASPIAVPAQSGLQFSLMDQNVYFSGVDTSNPGNTIGYVRVMIGISTSGNITEDDVEDIVINVPFYDTPATPGGWVSTGVKHPAYAAGLPDGGTAGQLLAKSANGAVWQDKNDVFNVQTGQALYVVGDSIAYGYGGSGVRIDSWVNHVIDRNGYDSTNSVNLAENGLGFCTTSTRNHTITDIVGGTSFAGADIVVVALGINDWKNTNATLSDLWSGMQYCFNKIRTDNPYCRIYYILPFNVSFSGAFATFYGLGFKGDSDVAKCYGNTLQTFINLIKSKFGEAAFKAYRVELIDMSECTAINRNNITTALFDNLHPSAATHIELGKEIARILSLSGRSGGVSAKVSDFTNDSNYLTLATLPVYNGGVQ